MFVYSYFLILSKFSLEIFLFSIVLWEENDQSFYF